MNSLLSDQGSSTLPPLPVLRVPARQTTPVPCPLKFPFEAVGLPVPEEPRFWSEFFVRDPSTGKTKSVVAPAHWSGNAVSILANKYMRKAGVPSTTVPVGVDYEHPIPLQGRTIPEWLLPSVAPLHEENLDAPVASTYEYHAHQVFHRLAGTWTYWAWLEGRLTEEYEALCFYWQTYLDLFEQRAAPNSPQWFNTGLHWAYGITGPAQGHWHVDANGEAAQSKDAYSRPQPHACFIQSVTDDLVSEEGIMGLWTREALVFKYGSGTGSNFSQIRGRGEKLSGGGTSSGLMSFLKIGDSVGGAIKSGGTTRRAAKMVCVDVDHPEIEEFIEWKAREEMKAAALNKGGKPIQEFGTRILHCLEDGVTQHDVIRALKPLFPTVHPKLGDRFLGIVTGDSKRYWESELENFAKVLSSVDMSTDWEGEAYSTISGQNSNNSIRISDEFMRAVQNDDVWHLRARTTGEVVKTVDASMLWRKICMCAWLCADPGLQFDTIINRANTCPAEGKINASNPCSEYMFLDDTACNLASVNLVQFLQKGDDSYTYEDFDFAAFAETCRRWTQILDISVTMAQFPSREMAIRSARYRTLGLGFANLGGALMRLGIPYDSEEGARLAGDITATMQASAILCTMDAAADPNLVPAARATAYRPSSVKSSWNQNNYDTWVVYRRQMTTADSRVKHPAARAVTQEALTRLEAAEVPYPMSEKTWDKPIFNNAQLTVIAPTGTISLLMDCDTTGIEPDFSLVKFKTLAGGGSMTIVNAAVEPALRKLGIFEETIASVVSGIENGKEIHEFDLGEHRERVLRVLAVASGNPKYAISVDGHLRAMAACQPFISGAISKTVNLPAGATPEDVNQTYWKAWHLDLKAVALYVDGCKLSQPLMNNFADSGLLAEDTVSEEIDHLPAASGTAPAEAQRRRLPDLRPSLTQRVQINGDTLHVSASFFPQTGELAEVFTSMYSAGSSMAGLLNVISKLASVALQYNVPAQEVLDVLKGTKFAPAGMVQGHETIRTASSVTDFIGQHLEYLMQESGRHIAPAPAPADAHPVAAQAAHADEYTTVRAAGYTGNVCSACGSMRMRRAGACETCEDCGTTSGCG